MTQEVTNFARFYALFNRLPSQGIDRAELKRSIVRQHTFGRTESLREVTWAEYCDCCAGLEKLLDSDWNRRMAREELRHWRSVCLKTMQAMGVRTDDWARVNDFCRHPRIAGRAFRDIDAEGLKTLHRKLQAIRRKGGLRAEEHRELYMIVMKSEKPAPASC